MKRNPRLVKVTEYYQSKPRQVDRENGRITGVKLLGWESKNGYSYVPAGVDPKLYEGRPINLNHVKEKNQTRDIRDRWGWAENCVRESDGIYGDICALNPKSDVSQSILTAAERAPQLFGLSQVAAVKQEKVNGKLAVAKVEEVLSLDMVDGPATVKSLYESWQPMKTVKQILLEVWADNPEQIKLVEAVDPGMLEPTVEPAPAADASQQIKDAFRAMVVAAFDDESLDTQATLAKIKEILKAQEKLMNSQSAADTPPEGEGDGGGDSGSGTTEGATPVDDPKVIKEHNAVLELIVESGIKFKTADARKAFVKSLVALSEAERKTLIEAQKEAAPAASAGRTSKPAAAAPTHNQSAPTITREESYKRFVQAVNDN